MSLTKLSGDYMRKSKLALAVALVMSSTAFAQMSSTTAVQEQGWNSTQWNMVGAPTEIGRAHV